MNGPTAESSSAASPPTVRIPYGHQHIDEADIAAVVRVLRSDWITQGPAIDQFEDRLTAVTGARYAVAFSSGTAALHAACAAAGFGPGSRVATSTLSFVASANCIRYVGATPVLMDIDPVTRNLDPVALPEGVDGLIAVHFAGLPIDLSLLPSRPPVVIEDAAHALGAATPDGPVGNCARSDMCCFSFHPVKAITTGEGGAVTTNDADLAAALRRFRNHGSVPTPDQGGWAYDIASLGYNYRLTDLQAALGWSQLDKLATFVARRNELAERYHRLLSEFPVRLPATAGPGWSHAYHLFAIEVPERRRVYDAMRSAGIGVQVHYPPIHQHSLYRQLAGPAYPVAERVAAGLLSLPLFYDLHQEQQDEVVDALRRAL